MIKLSENFEIEPPEHCWVLVEWRDGINPKTKKPTRTQRKTYHSNLEQLFSAMMSKGAKLATTVEELKAILRTRIEMETRMCRLEKLLGKMDSGELEGSDLVLWQECHSKWWH